MLLDSFLLAQSTASADSFDSLIQALPSWIPDWARAKWLVKAIATLLILIIGIPIIRFITTRVAKATSKRLNVSASMLMTKAAKYALYVTLILGVLGIFGVTPTAILGAAGVAGVAIGFASQTSLSNVISGLFLIGERPFRIGDLIEVNNTTGVVDSINLLSCHLRTLDNKMVRIPNETLVKTMVTNISRHPIRRVNLDISVSYDEDINTVTRILKEEIEKHPLALEEPAPLIMFKGFGDSSLDFLVGAWAQQSDFLGVKNGLLQAIKERFDTEGIEIPFPHITLATGKAAATIPAAKRGD